MMLFLVKLSYCLMVFNGIQPVSRLSSTDLMEAEILQYVNEDRKDHGMAPLQVNALESSLASKHSQDMAAGKVKFGHDGFDKRAKSIQQSLGSTEIGENVAEGPMTAREVVDGWLNSPGHKKNIEGHFTLTGIGYARDNRGNIYFTQIFSR